MRPRRDRSHLGRRSPRAAQQLNPVAHQIAVALLDDVADMDADAEVDPTVLRHAGNALNEAVLNLDRAADRVDHAAKLDNAPIARAFDDTTMMSRNSRIDQIAAEPPQARKGPILVGAGEPAITDDIRNQDRRELAGLAHRAPFGC